MSSRGRRSSILKKQQAISVSYNAHAQSASASCKSVRKIEFNRKKSIKEFMVGDDADTIWGNSYEVSTDTTPSTAPDDATLGNSISRNSADNENKENHLQNLQPPVGGSVHRSSGSNGTNISVDLSITIAEDEKRRIRNNSPVRQSLNTTDRLFVDPFEVHLSPRLKPSIENAEVQAMDISPLKSNVLPSLAKSPRKVIYSFPKQAMFVEINDVPVRDPPTDNEKPQTEKGALPKASNRSTWRHGIVPILHEPGTYNNHPNMADPANESSDVDTTIALTTAMTKVLESLSNDSIQRAANMDLDESTTTTFPTNALSRARPSFLPSEKRPIDVSQDVYRTPANVKQNGVNARLTVGLEETNAIDISSPVEGYVPRGNVSLENLSILQDCSSKIDSKLKIMPDSDPSKCALPTEFDRPNIDFDISALSLKLRPSSPDMPSSCKARILRPTLPSGLFETRKEKSETAKAIVQPDRNRTEDPRNTTGSRMTVGMEDSVKLRKKSRPTVFDVNDIIDENAEQKVRTAGRGLRKTVVYNEQMELSHTPATERIHSEKNTRQSIYEHEPIVEENDRQCGSAAISKTKKEHNKRGTVLGTFPIDETGGEMLRSPQAASNHCEKNTRRSIYEHEPIVEENIRQCGSTATEQTKKEHNKRGTVLGTFPIDETDEGFVRSPQAALNHYRKTIYQLQAMDGDEPDVQPLENPGRKTIVSNDSMVLDMCATSTTKPSSESTLSCVVHGHNINELSIHAVRGGSAVDMKIVRPTTFHPQPCDEETHMDAKRKSVIDVENMILADESRFPNLRQRLTTLVAQPIDGPTASTEMVEKMYTVRSSSRKSNLNTEEMQRTCIMQPSESPCPEDRYSMHATEVMDESNVEKLVCVRMEQLREATLLSPDHAKHGRAIDDKLHEGKSSSSRIPRYTLHRSEHMQIEPDEGNNGAGARHSIHHRVDMDLAHAGDRAANARSLDNVQEKKQKSRTTIYERENMDMTASGDRHVAYNEASRTDPKPKLSVYQCTTMKETDTVHQVDVTEMVMDESKVGVEKEVRITYQPKTSDPTGQCEVSRNVQYNMRSSDNRPRPSTYNVVAMDETNVNAHETECITNKREPPFRDQRNHGKGTLETLIHSPMRMSPVVLVSDQATNVDRSQRSRKSIYHPEEMERTHIGETKTAREERKTFSECFALRKSNLQNAIADMEGISLLIDNSIDTNQSRKQAVEILKEGQVSKNRGTIFYDNVETRITNDNSPVDPQNVRLSDYCPDAMVEETVPFAVSRSRQARTLSLDHGTMDAQRKSNDRMDVTIVPDNIRVDRASNYSWISRASAVADTSPIVCPAVLAPSITEGYGVDDLQPERTRQTIHKPANMDMTLIQRRSVTQSSSPVGAVDRRTIYNNKPMEETPPQCGLSRECDRKNTHMTPQVKRTSTVRPRQTILITEDMEVEEEEEAPAMTKDERSPITLSMLPRETTEDRFPRCAALLSKPMGDPFGAPTTGLYSNFSEFDESHGSNLKQKQASSQFSLQHVDEDARKTIPLHEMSDIYMSTSTTMRLELPHLANITGMGSMREITEPSLPLAPLPEYENSISVIRRTDSTSLEPAKSLVKNDIGGKLPLAFEPIVNDVPSDDEFYDAEGEAHVTTPPVDPLSLTKSHLLTMKFVDVEQLEQTNYTAVSETTSKRLLSQVVSSPDVGRKAGDPLRMTNVRQQSMDVPLTPQEPALKRPRTSCITPRVISVEHPGEISMELPVQEDRTIAGVAGSSSNHEQKTESEVDEPNDGQTKPSDPVRWSQTIIQDPTVFAIDDEDLLDDESDLPCSLTEDIIVPEPAERVTPTECVSTDSKQKVDKLKDLSYYRDFINLTIDNLDLWNDEENKTPGEEMVREEAPNNGSEPEAMFVTECISLSDDESLSITPPKNPLPETLGLNAFVRSLRRPPVGEDESVLESTIADDIMNELRKKNPMYRYPCCQNDIQCLCRLRRDLKRHQEEIELVYGRWSSRIAAIKERLPVVEKVDAAMTFEAKMEELNWRLFKAQLDDSFLYDDDLSRVDISRRHSRTPTSGQYPETPSIVFLAENLQCFLLEQSVVDNSPSPGAPLPEIPRITQLYSNKLSTVSRWMLDLSEEDDGVLLLRHRTLRSFVVSVRLQPPAGQPVETGVRENPTESWRLARIQVREYQQEYVHSPKLLLAHIEFMRLAKQTTERTLRSLYRTVGALMGLWQWFDEILRRVFDAVNRLNNIIRNNEGLLLYDAQMERFCVKKYFERMLEGGKVEPNMVWVHFHMIENIGSGAVSFNRSVPETDKLLPATTGGTSSKDEKTGIMFLECLFWNLTKQYGMSCGSAVSSANICIK